MRYEHPEPIERSDALVALASPDAEVVCLALISVVLHDPDAAWVEARVHALADHPSVHVRKLVAICFGHLARLHRTLDLVRVKPVLTQLAHDPVVAGCVEDAVDDIEVFMKERLRIPRPS